MKYTEIINNINLKKIYLEDLRKTIKPQEDILLKEIEALEAKKNELEAKAFESVAIGEKKVIGRFVFSKRITKKFNEKKAIEFLETAKDEKDNKLKQILRDKICKVKYTPQPTLIKKAHLEEELAFLWEDNIVTGIEVLDEFE